MIKGADISSLIEVQEERGKFYDGDKQIDPLEALWNNGIYHLRLRVWNNPHTPMGVNYLGGTCDIDHYCAIGERAHKYGFDLTMDLHYSDFWADPGKQFVPKDWKFYDLRQLYTAIYDFTKECLQKAKEHHCLPRYIQIGNEITNGMLWPHGKTGEGEMKYIPLINLISYAARACRKVAPDSEIILHLDQGGNKALYDEFFSTMEKYHVVYDVIGASYYPYWHGPMEDLFDNMEFCRKFGKKRMIMEFAYGFTDQPYELPNGEPVKLVIHKENSYIPGFTEKYPLTPQGQADYVRDFMANCRQAELDGVFYWEPMWIPGKNICWASPEGQAYVGVFRQPTANDWANQCLFDYQGRKLPAFDAFR